MDHLNRRKGDTLENKLLKTAAIVGAVATLGFGFFTLGGLKFETKTDNLTAHTCIKAEVQIVKEDVLVMKNDLVYIKDAVKEIKEAVKK